MSIKFGEKSFVRGFGLGVWGYRSISLRIISMSVTGTWSVSVSAPGSGLASVSESDSGSGLLAVAVGSSMGWLRFRAEKITIGKPAPPILKYSRASNAGRISRAAGRRFP